MRRPVPRCGPEALASRVARSNKRAKLAPALDAALSTVHYPRPASTGERDSEDPPPPPLAHAREHAREHAGAHSGRRERGDPAGLALACARMPTLDEAIDAAISEVCGHQRLPCPPFPPPSTPLALPLPSRVGRCPPVAGASTPRGPRVKAPRRAHPPDRPTPAASAPPTLGLRRSSARAARLGIRHAGPPRRPPVGPAAAPPRRHPRGVTAPPPFPPHLVLSGHAASLIPYESDTPRHRARGRQRPPRRAPARRGPAFDGRCGRGALARGRPRAF